VSLCAARHGPPNFAPGDSLRNPEPFLYLWGALSVGLLMTVLSSTSLASAARLNTSPNWSFAVAGFALVFGGATVSLLATFWGSRRPSQRQVEREHSIAGRTSQQVGRQVGADPGLVELVSNATVFTEGRSDLMWLEQSEVARRVVESSLRLGRLLDRLEAQEAAAEQLQERVRNVEDKFPQPADFQKYADSNQLFLAYQIGELGKRLERIESGQMTRFQVVGYVVATLVAASAAASGVVVLLQAAHLIH
jgi:hypothetical protein